MGIERVVFFTFFVLPHLLDILHMHMHTRQMSETQLLAIIFVLMGLFAFLMIGGCYWIINDEKQQAAAAAALAQTDDGGAAEGDKKASNDTAEVTEELK